MPFLDDLHEIAPLTGVEAIGTKVIEYEQVDIRQLAEEPCKAAVALIASQLPVKAWHDLIGEPTFADAILDRIVHNSYRLELEGERSMREGEPDSGAPALTASTASNGKPAKGARK